MYSFIREFKSLQKAIAKFNRISVLATNTLGAAAAKAPEML